MSGNLNDEKRVIQISRALDRSKNKYKVSSVRKSLMCSRNHRKHNEQGRKGYKSRKLAKVILEIRAM